MISEVEQVFNIWGTFLQDRLNGQIGLLSSEHIAEICNLYNQKKCNITSEPTYNLFEVISDLYYRENFHSDIIAHWLNPTEKHGMDSLPLSCFIRMIQKCGCSSICEENYQEAHVIREQPTGNGFIDIAIMDFSSMHAFIIENKINNAGDMDRQIPRYCDYLEGEGFTVDAAIYLPLDIHSKPDKSTWKENDYKREAIIYIVPAYCLEDRPNLIKDWIRPLTTEEITNENVSNLEQYSRLIKKLSKQNMDKVSLEQFYQTLLQGQNLEIANSISAMMKDLPSYLATRIYDTYSIKCAPFEKIWIYKDADAVFENCVFNGLYLKIDVWCDTNMYNVMFWTPKNEDADNRSDFIDIAQFATSNGLNCFDGFELENKYRMWKHYPISTPFNEVIDPILQALLKNLR